MQLPQMVAVSIMRRPEYGLEKARDVRLHVRCFMISSARRRSLPIFDPQPSMGLLSLALAIRKCLVATHVVGLVRGLGTVVSRRTVSVRSILSIQWRRNLKYIRIPYQTFYHSIREVLSVA